MSMVLAGAFLTFLGFLFAGLLALAFTAALDRSLGKERALLLFTGILLLFTLWQCTPEAVKATGRPGPERTVPGDRLDVAREPTRLPHYRPPLERDPASRNPFQKHSDTRALEPIVLTLPPWLPNAFQLPPTIPGPGPEARGLLRGDLPTLQPGDGTTIPEIPKAVFADYEPVPEDLYDWIVDRGRKSFVYVRSIRHEGRTHKEGDEKFLPLLLMLAAREPGWESMQVEYALIGSEDVAKRNLEPTDVLRRRREAVSTAPADQFDRWVPRRSVEVLYHETLSSLGLPWDPSSARDIGSLRAAARRMAEVGRTGKEERSGWRRAADLLQVALEQARQRATPAVRAEILEELVAAHVALREERAVLRVLSEFARTSPNRPDPWVWLGRLHRESLGIPEEALGYYEVALERASRNPDALIGYGDTLSALGDHAGALEAYRNAGSSYAARVRVAEALLRLGRLDAAQTAADAALALQEEGPRALLAFGGVLYAKGELEEARGVFERAALATGPEALELRAQACYDLGLACWRLGQADAAVAAFDACDDALSYGSSPQRYADEAVSPAFGRALVALAAGNEGGMRSALQEAREEAPRVAYHEALAGMIASRAGDDAAAVRGFDRALRFAGVYPALDGWLARTRLRLGQLALAAGTPIKEATEDFEAAVAFAARASQTEKKEDPKAFHARLREAWILLGAEHLPARRRYDSAKAVTNSILSRIDREQPAALAIRGYCYYQLAAFGIVAVGENVDDAYDPCIRDFQQVLNKVPADDEGPWRVWRDYAADVLGQVKRWRSLEEKLIAFDEGTLTSEFKLDEGGGVNALFEEDVARLDGDADEDGTLDEPIFKMRSDQQFKVGTFEELRMRLRIPARDRSGSATNTITFGVQVQRASRSGSTRVRYAGIGVFYDRGKVAVRIGGGQEERWKDGGIHRLVPEAEWPSDDWVEVRIVRTDPKEGRMQVWLDADPDDGQEGELVAEDVVSGFKGTTRTPAELWIGGFSTQAQRWLVEFKDMRVVRRK